MPKAYEIEWTETARNDLNENVDYIGLDSIDNAMRINDTLISKVDSLKYFPNRGRIVPELRKFGIANYREVIITSYRIFVSTQNLVVKKAFLNFKSLGMLTSHHFLSGYEFSLG